MSKFIDTRALFVLEKKTAYWLSKATGIPMSTAYRFSKGLGGIPDIYRDVVRNIYQRETYSRLRQTGSSSIQARRFAALKPDSVKGVIADLNYKVGELARGYAVKRVESLKLKPTESNIKRFLSAGSRKIREGLRNSKQPIEVWMDYGTFFSWYNPNV